MKSVALVSGKGGSGKTSLSLILGSLLSSCGVKTLIVDCDLATNGATYFFEDKLQDNVSSVGDIIKNTVLEHDFNSILSGDMFTDYSNYIQVNDFLYFLPSETKIAGTSGTSYVSANDAHRFGNILRKIERRFDYIIYDTQAGYSELLNIAVQHSDSVLFIVEPDAISSSSLRSLYLKIGRDLENRKTYQVFNKVSSDEYEAFSKITTGTLFTTLATIRYNWQIRRAFALGNIPESKWSIELTNVAFEIAKQICDNSSIEASEKIYKEKARLAAREEIAKIRGKRKGKYSIYEIMLVAINTLIISLMVSFFLSRQYPDLDISGLIIALLSSASVIMVLIFTRQNIQKSSNIAKSEYEAIERNIIVDLSEIK